MIYQPTSAFSWDRLFRPSVMTRILTYLGLRKKGIIKFLNFPSFAVVILIFAVGFFPIALPIRWAFGQRALQKVTYRFFGWVWLAAFGVYRKVWYHPSIRRDGSYIYMSEHMSLFDVPLFGTTWPTDTRALSAKEYASVPMYGWILRTIGTQFIERRDRQQAIKDLDELAIRMEKEGISALVVPTGTRSPTNEPLPFKKGVFHTAARLKRPIVPIYFIGLEELTVEKNFIRPGRVDVVYGAPVSPDKHPEAFESPETLLTFMERLMRQEGGEIRRNRRQFIDYKPSAA